LLELELVSGGLRGVYLVISCSCGAKMNPLLGYSTYKRNEPFPELVLCAPPAVDNLRMDSSKPTSAFLPGAQSISEKYEQHHQLPYQNPRMTMARTGQSISGTGTTDRLGSRPLDSQFLASSNAANRHYKYNFLASLPRTAPGQSEEVNETEELGRDPIRRIRQREQELVAAGLGYGKTHRDHYQYISQCPPSRARPVTSAGRPLTAEGRAASRPLTSSGRPRTSPATTDIFASRSVRPESRSSALPFSSPSDYSNSYRIEEEDDQPESDNKQATQPVDELTLLEQEQTASRLRASSLGYGSRHRSHYAYLYGQPLDATAGDSIIAENDRWRTQTLQPNLAALKASLKDPLNASAILDEPSSTYRLDPHSSADDETRTKAMNESTQLRVFGTTWA